VDDYSQKAIVLRVSGKPSARIHIGCEKPTRCELTRTLAQVERSSEALFTGPFPLESAMLHRLVFAENHESSFTVEDEDSGDALNWYYVRVLQSNGEMAWSSPIWVEKRS
jgi:hypothetical protein